MALTDKLTAVADAIRFKSGKTSKITLDNMPTEIKALTTEELLKVSDYPSYVTTEVLDVVNRVRSVQKNDSITFIAMSDSHYHANQNISFYDTETNASTIQANQAAKLLTYLLKPDFFAHLGDITVGAGSTTPELLKTQVEGFINYFREAKSDLPVFICIGNHDSGIYYHDKQIEAGKTDIFTLPGNYLYNNFTAHSESDNTVVSGKENGGYCYRDFADKKLRVIMLNTSEKLVARQKDSTTFGAQRLWLANALLDLNNKPDAANWGFIILCHYPADFGATMPLSSLLESYVKGTSFTITDPADSDYYRGDGTNQLVNFSGKNGAKFIAQFHGHIHNFLTSKLYGRATGSLLQYDAWRICIPNGQFNRENTYGVFSDVNFADTQAYHKTYGTVDGTSFVVNVINPSEEKIYSFCYGAGIDRVIGYAGTVYHSVSLNGRNVTNPSETFFVEAGQPYSITLIPTEGYKIKTVKVTMGTTDVTDLYYKDGVITIPEVTDNINITATAVIDLDITNWLPISTDIDENVIYNEIGYKENSYLSGGEVGERDGVYTSGFIPCKPGETLYFKNCTLPDNNKNCRFSAYNSSKTFLDNHHWNTENDGTHILITYGDDGNISELKITDNEYMKNVAFIRFCCIGLGEDSIVTKEPIGAPPAVAINRIPISIDTDESIYNGKGYKENYRISTSTGEILQVDGFYLSGLIPIDFNTQSLILYNVGTEMVKYSHSIVVGVNADKISLNGSVDLDSLTPDPEGGFLTITSANWPKTDLNRVKYIRISCSYIGEDSSAIVIDN